MPNCLLYSLDKEAEEKSLTEEKLQELLVEFVVIDR